MKKLSTLLLLSLFIASAAKAQSDERITGSQVYAEMGGPGILFSASYDRRFKAGTDTGLGFRIGMGMGVSDYHDCGTSTCSDYSWNVRSYITFPLGLNYVLGKSDSPHAFEVGAGATILTRKVPLYYYDDAKPGNVVGHLAFMYRRKPIDGGFTWRIGFTPIIGTSGDIIPSGVVGFGYAF